MFNWYNNKKEQKDFLIADTAYKAFSIDIDRVKAKLEEIYEVDLTKEEKDPLIQMLNAQIKAIKEDRDMYGLGMSRFFDTSTKISSRNIPIGVEIPDEVMSKIHADISLIGPRAEILSTEEDVSPSEASKDLDNELTKVLASDLIQEQKLETINKSRFNIKIKNSLTKIQTKFIDTRKEYLDDLVSKYQTDGDLADVEKLAVTEAYLENYTSANPEHISKELVSVQASYDSAVHNTIYKRPVINSIPFLFNKYGLRSEVRVMLMEQTLATITDERAILIPITNGTGEWSN